MAWRRKEKRPGKTLSGPGAVLAALGIAAIGIVPMVLYAPAAMREVYAWATWREVECEILESARLDAEGRSRHRNLYRPHVAYRYVVDGEAYTSDRVFPRPVRMNARGSARLLKSYPVGSRQTCRVDPADGSSAVLRPINPGNLGWLVVALPWPVIGGMMLLRMARRR